MKVFITGHKGYIGSVMIPMLRAAGHDITGMDTFFFSDQGQQNDLKDFREVLTDIRELEPASFMGCEAVIHLAALSIDPLSEINPALTLEINHIATKRIAEAAKKAGIKRFLFASTCSVYGMVSQDEIATEETTIRPLTPYAVSKAKVEEDLDRLADETFSPVILRNATAYGWSPNFRSDLVVNNLAGWAYTKGEIRIMSDGTPWRPIVHVQDIVRAFSAVLTAQREAIHNQVFNVGVNTENYQVRELAEIVREEFHGCRLTYDEHGGPDPRSYRVDFSKINRQLPEFKPSWTARTGVEELREAYEEIKLNHADFIGPKYVRIAKLKSLIKDGKLDEDLRWKKQ